MSDDEILSGFTSLRDAIQRGFARHEQRLSRRIETLELRVSQIERRLDRIESRLPVVDPALERVESRRKRLRAS